MNFIQDDLEQRLRDAWTGLQRRTVEQSHEIGEMLFQARETADRRDGGFRGVYQRANIPEHTAYRLIRLYERYPESCNLQDFSSVAAALQAPDSEDEISTPVTATDNDPEPAIPEAADPTEPPADSERSEMDERVAACLEDPDYSEDEHAKMRGNALNVTAGVMSPEAFLERWERKAEPETPPDPVVATPIDDTPQTTHTERAVVRPAATPRKTDKDRLAECRAHCERLEEQVKTMEHEKLDLLQRIEDLEQNERILLSKPQGEAGIMQCYKEASTLRAQKATLTSSVAKWQTKYEDERRRVQAYAKMLRQNGIDVSDPAAWPTGKDGS